MTDKASGRRGESLQGRRKPHHRLLPLRQPGGERAALAVDQGEVCLGNGNGRFRFLNARGKRGGLLRGLFHGLPRTGGLRLQRPGPGFGGLAIFQRAGDGLPRLVHAGKACIALGPRRPPKAGPPAAAGQGYGGGAIAWR